MYSRIYLKGYYGYKNFGDELLLLGVINYLVSAYACNTIVIETPDQQWLRSWINSNKDNLPNVSFSYASTILETIKYAISCDLIAIGGGEVVTNARSFPHNGWNYLFRNYPLKLLGKKIILLGGFGTSDSYSTGLLHYLLYRGAHSITTREQASYQRVTSIVSKEKVTAHTDFSYSILNKYHKDLEQESVCIINCNPYIWSAKTKQKIIQYIKKGNFDSLVYIPAEITIDAPMYESLKIDFPELFRYDWTQHSLEEITTLIASSSGGIAARLHILILLDYYGIPYQPLVYQEKITKILGHA